MATSEVVRTLFVTLRKSLARRPEQTRRVVKSLGLRKIDSVKELPNNASVRGAVDRVKHMVVVETDASFLERMVATTKRRAQRDPLTVSH
mmetsp:Transcript_11298/g.69774  ORF Transcript_11298/g.69774 Transcript_11298/m.69774 type:complete len:90 (+) Transcript_11298:58-327(+)|eukprot:CAMPEP_0113922524 /NCGR_PEP_ID=MMETSP1159-20121227/1658_1 /TAXON_ID=88271 /ORGANISM="Picocystis salinarum" /LENGTH=89 /DNA_ID=CAMNT_0000922637 /DNA_START=138 /DNA_END=407 /DNA_ORIENTATION=+ /assembly_acc=CAM_ASM_000767